MTIKVTKPAINVIEKLNELKQDTGLKGQELMRADTITEARTAIGAGRKNMFINGGMDVWQRGDSFSGIASGENKVADRWRSYFGGGTGVHTASRDTDTPPGFAYSLKLAVTTADSAVAAGDRWNLAYRQERSDTNRLKSGTPEAQSCTVSFWVKSSVTGTYCLDYYVYTSTPTCSRQYTIDVANVWEYKTMTFDTL